MFSQNVWVTFPKCMDNLINSTEFLKVILQIFKPKEKTWFLVAGTRLVIALGMDQENLIWMKSAMQSLIRASQDTASVMRTP